MLMETVVVLFLLSKRKNCKWKQQMDQSRRTTCLRTLLISSIHFMVSDHDSVYFPLGVLISDRLPFFISLRGEFLCHDM